jgi:hypothetical protein
MQRVPSSVNNPAARAGVEREAMNHFSVHTTCGRRPARLPLALLFLCLTAAAAAQPARQRGIDIDTTPVKTLPAEGKRWALIIGINDYEDDGLTPLKGATPDAHLLADALRMYAGFPSQNIYLMASDQPKEWQPRRNNILARMSDIKRQMPKDGLLLFAFSGHGIEVGDHVLCRATRRSATTSASWSRPR